MSEILTKLQRLELVRSQLDTDYKQWEPLFKDLNDYILPTRGLFLLNDHNRGDRRNHKIIDNTATMAVGTFSSGMMAGVTSPARNWKRLTTSDPELAEYGPVKEWLNIIDMRMSTFFLRSNLYNILPAAYMDLATFGISAILMEEDNDTVSRYYSIPVGSFRAAKNRRGHVEVFTRDIRMTVRQTVETFGKVDPKTGKAKMDNFSQFVKNEWDRSNYETTVDVTHFIEPNQNYNPNKPLDPKAKKYSSHYYERNAGEQSNEKAFLREHGYSFFPILCNRWMVTGSTAYSSFFPGVNAIGDIKQLQHGERRIAQAIDKMVNPPMLADANLRAQKTSILSGDVTYVDTSRGEKFEAAHKVQIDLSHIENKQMQVRDRVRRAFYEDLFLMLASSDRKQYTATEIVERKEEKLLAVGPVLEQLNQDQNDPLIDNNFFLMNEQGLLPEAPEELQNQDLKVEYISIMAQAQKMIALGGLDRLLQVGSQILTVNPESADKFDFDQIIDEYAEGLGTSPRVTRSDERVEEIRVGRAQAQKAQQQMEMINQGAQAAKNLSGASLDGNNALSQLTESLTGQPGLA